MKIAICDDEALCRKQVMELAQAYTQENSHLHLSVSVFPCAEDLLEAAGKVGGFELYILDILMPGMSGIQLGVSLREAGYDGKIIYLTSSEEYAIDSFKARPFDYLLKPVKRDAFFSALDEALRSVSRQKETGVIVKTRESSVRLALDSILYAELCNRVIVYHLTGGKTVETVQIRTTFTEAIQELLQDNRFFLCGKSIAANLHHITMVEKDAVVFKDGTRVYLPKKACNDVRSAWNDFWLNGEGSK